MLRTPAIFDGRNLYDPAEVRENGLEYYIRIGRLGHVSSWPVARSSNNEQRGVSEVESAAGFVQGEAAGGRRRDARSLLVRRGEPHLAGGAGAGGQGRAHRGASRRRVQRRAQCDGPGCAGNAAVGGRRRRSVRAPARTGRSRAGHRLSAQGPQHSHHRQAARDREATARCASISKPSQPNAGGLLAISSCCSPTATCWSDYGKRVSPTSKNDRTRAPPANHPGRSQGRIIRATMARPW